MKAIARTAAILLVAGMALFSPKQLSAQKEGGEKGKAAAGVFEAENGSFLRGGNYFLLALRQSQARISYEKNNYAKIFPAKTEEVNGLASYQALIEDGWNMAVLLNVNYTDFGKYQNSTVATTTTNIAFSTSLKNPYAVPGYFAAGVAIQKILGTGMDWETAGMTFIPGAGYFAEIGKNCSIGVSANYWTGKRIAGLDQYSITTTAVVDKTVPLIENLTLNYTYVETDQVERNSNSFGIDVAFEGLKDTRVFSWTDFKGTWAVGGMQNMGVFFVLAKIEVVTQEAHYKAGSIESGNIANYSIGAGLKF